MATRKKRRRTRKHIRVIEMTRLQSELRPGELENERVNVEEEQASRAGRCLWTVLRCGSFLSLGSPKLTFDQAGTDHSSRSNRLVNIIYY